MKVQIRKLNESNRLSEIAVPVASETVIVPGDLIKMSSGKGVVCVENKDCDGFIGVALGGSPAGESVDIAVCSECVFEATMASADYAIGDEVAIKADGSCLEKSAADTIGWVVEATKGTATKAKVYINTLALGKLFKVNATTT